MIRFTKPPDDAGTAQPWPKMDKRGKPGSKSHSPWDTRPALSSPSTFPPSVEGLLALLRLPPGVRHRLSKIGKADAT